MLLFDKAIPIQIFFFQHVPTFGKPSSKLFYFSCTGGLIIVKSGYYENVLSPNGEIL